MQPQRRGSSDVGGRGRPVAIPGARPSGDWAVVIGGDSASIGGESVGLPSTQEGLFGSSLRRHHSEHGGYGSSLGHSLGHGAWLSSSLPRGSARLPSGMHKSPSLGRQYSGVGLAAHEEEEEHAAAAAAAAAGAGATPPAAAPAGLRASLDRRCSVDKGGSPPEAHHTRPQRWHLGAHAEPSASNELAEPLLSAELSDPGYPLPGTPHSQKAGDAPPGVPGSPWPAAPPDPGVVVARDVTGADRGQGELSRALVFGGINSVATIPALVAYAAIVFKDPIYAPYIDQLCKFFFLSSAIHQTVFCLLSTLPFSVGQVQDVGLIFLSAMASSIAGLCLDAGRDAATALGTSLLTMSVATFFTGAMTLLVARYRLAQLVQYLPLPVIGGYLSFVGYFCVASGIGLGVSQDIGTIASWVSLFQADALVKLVPTVLSCLAMILTLERFSHPLALPAVMLLINLAFHAVRLALGVTLEQAMDASWVIRPAEGEQFFWQLWDLFNIKGWSLSGIYFPAMTDQVVKMLGLALVVIFGSAMDIAAIQQDTPKKIDFNRELVTVAVSNMATGAAGCGYTGSYIFSQTIFTMRAGVYSRWNGVVVAASEFAMFALPFPVIQYMPNFFFGALLLWFGIEISRDWLLLSFTKMTRIEYGLLLATFGAIMQWGLEGGIAAGIVLATLYFAAAYAQSQVASIGVADTARSTVVRTVEQQAALDMLGGRLACICLNGFVFFGCANSIGQRLQEEAERLGGRQEPEAAAREQAELEEAIGTSLRTVGERFVGVKHTQAAAALAAAPAYLVLDLGSVRGLDATGARTMGVVHVDLAQHGVVLVVTGADHHGIRPLLLAHGVPLPPQPMRWPPGPAQAHASDIAPGARGSQAASPRGHAPAAAGIMAGGASDGSPLTSLAAEQPWESGRYPGESEDGLQPTCLEFTTLEEGLRYCEDQLLEVVVRYGLCPAPSALLPLEAMLASHLQKLPLAGLDPAGAAAALRRYMTVVSLSAGQLLWKLDDPANDLFVIEKGAVRVDEFVHQAAASAEPPDDKPAAAASGAPPVDTLQALRAAALKSASAASLPDRDGAGRRVLARSYECGPGCVVGSTDFYLARPHGTRAVCRSAVARVLRVSRSAMERMAAEVPQALNVLQLAVMRANTLDLSQAAAQRRASQP